MDSLTPEQQLRLCRAIWPGEEWVKRPAPCVYKEVKPRRDDGSPWRYNPHLDCSRCADPGYFYEQADLTSNEAVGAMVALLCQHNIGGTRAMSDALDTLDYPEHLARLVLKVIGDE